MQSEKAIDAIAYLLIIAMAGAIYLAATQSQLIYTWIALILVIATAILTLLGRWTRIFDMLDDWFQDQETEEVN